MLTLLAGLGAALATGPTSDQGIQSAKAEEPSVQAKQKMNPTAFRQPQPMMVRSTQGLDTRYFRTRRHPKGLGQNLRVAPQSSKSDLFSVGGITPVLTDPNFYDRRDASAVKWGAKNMTTRARGIPNAGLDEPNEPLAKMAAYRSNPYYEPEQAEVHFIGDNKHIGIPMKYDRDTELGIFHYPHEIYRPDARTEVERRMVGAAKLYYPPKTRQTHTDLIASEKEEAVSSYKPKDAKPTVCPDGSSPTWGMNKKQTCQACWCINRTTYAAKRVPDSICGTATTPPSVCGQKPPPPPTPPSNGCKDGSSPTWGINKANTCQNCYCDYLTTGAYKVGAAMCSQPPPSNACKTPPPPPPNHEKEIEYIILGVAAVVGGVLLYRLV